VPRLKPIIDFHETSVAERMNQRLAEAPIGIARDYDLRRANPIGNLLTEQMLATSEAEVAVHNLGGIRADIPAGTVTVRSLFMVSPFGNSLVTVKLAGKHLRALLEKHLANPSRGFAIRGLTVRWIEKDGRRTIDAVLFDGALDDERELTVVTTDYLAGAADGASRSCTRAVAAIRHHDARHVDRAHSGSGNVARRRRQPLDRSCGRRTQVMERLHSLLGFFAILGVAWVLCPKDLRGKVDRRTLGFGILLLIVSALVVLKTPIKGVFASMQAGVDALMGFCDVGSKFVFGEEIVKPDGKLGFVFFARALPPILFFSALMSVLYHLRILPMVVRFLGRTLSKVLGTSGAESFSTAADIFVGQSGSPAHHSSVSFEGDAFGTPRRARRAGFATTAGCGARHLTRRC
jgi:hypothetical protein